MMYYTFQVLLSMKDALDASNVFVHERCIDG